MKGNDIFVFEFFYKGNFVDGCGGCVFFGVEVNFFEGDEFIGLVVVVFEDLNVVKWC